MRSLFRQLVFFALLVAPFCRCAAMRAQPAAMSADAYRAIADEFLAGYLAWRPQEAVSLGLHEFDGQTTDLSRASIDGEKARLHAFRSKLAAIDGAALDGRADVQRRLLIAAIDNELFEFEQLKSYTRNPMTYANAIDVNMYAKRDFAPKPERLKSVIRALRQMPSAMKAARENLEPVLPTPYVETAILVAEGGARFFERDLGAAFADVTDEPMLSEFREAATAAAGELRDFVDYLRTEKLPLADDSFAIGREAYVRMLADGELISHLPEEILQIGLRELRRGQEVFAATAARIDAGKTPEDVYQEIQRDHPTAESFLADTRKHLEMIREFLVKRDLITFPSDVRVIVDETPRYARATSFASMDSPGPFETKGSEAYYYVTPVEPEWESSRQEEWLTAFNFYTTDVVSIHEAYPGHYVQFLHLQASDADRIDKVFGSYAFIEGWAHYCEQMAVDEAFGVDQGLLAGEKYRLAQSAEALLRLCRLCVSIQMHTQGMTLEDGVKFFMTNCYYKEAPARSEATRGTFDPGYCFYTIGKLQLLKLRKDYSRQMGGNFSLKRFHDELLRHGAPPVRLLREIMLSNRAEWDKTL